MRLPVDVGRFSLRTRPREDQISGDTYDSAGNLLSGLGMGPFTYDAENRLLTAGGVTYSYDGDGKRAKKSNGKLYWYGMSSDANTETDSAGNNPVEYIFFGGKRIARRDSVGAISYYFADHLGSSRIVTNSSGMILDDSDFYPFGGERVVSTSSGNSYKFTGKERDGESGLDNFGARYMSSAMGRFLSADNPKFSEKYEPQTWNLYSYVSNDPLSRIDPTGHNWFNINGAWKWFEGSDVTDDGKACKKGTKGCIHSDYTHLLVIQKKNQRTPQGAAVVKITLWGNTDPTKSKPIAEGTGFTGGTGIITAPNGNYEINLNNRGGLETNRIVATANGLELGAFHDGIQQVGDSIAYRGQYYDATGEWGTLRANLSKGPGQGTLYYLHGKNLYFTEGRTYTLGCVCEPNQQVLRVIFSLDPSGVGEGSKNGRIAVSVNKPN